MDFRKNKKGYISHKGITSRDYGLYDNLVFTYNKPLSDKQIQWITEQIQSQNRLETAFDNFIMAKLEKGLKPQIDKAIEETIGKELKKLFSSMR